MTNQIDKRYLDFLEKSLAEDTDKWKKYVNNDYNWGVSTVFYDSPKYIMNDKKIKFQAVNYQILDVSL